MIRIVAIQLILVAIAAEQTLSNIYSPSVWEYAKNGNERRFYLNTYNYCNYTKKAMESANMIEKKGNTKNGVDVLFQGNGKHLGCGEVILKGGDEKNWIVCGNFRNNWTEGICRIHGIAVDYTFKIYENIHVYKRS